MAVARERARAMDLASLWCKAMSSWVAWSTEVKGQKKSCTAKTILSWLFFDLLLNVSQNVTWLKLRHLMWPMRQHGRLPRLHAPSAKIEVRAHCALKANSSQNRSPLLFQTGSCFLICKNTENDEVADCDSLNFCLSYDWMWKSSGFFAKGRTVHHIMLAVQVWNT